MKSPASASFDPFPEISGYTIIEQIYLSSRTAVYRAVQVAQQRPVVIKVLRCDYPSFAELVQFRNQYTIAQQLPIAGIVQPLSLEPLGSGYALVMEDVGGISLSKYLQQQSLELTEVLVIGLQLAKILHDLSQYRVVHKDIKPANILIQPESKQVKLIDFSIASLLPKEIQEIHSPNLLEGTLAYLAPEQTGRMNRGIDYRADFYALGVTLYQLLTGTLPFQSDEPLELIHAHIAKTPVPINQLNPSVPAMVAAIVDKLMAKNAEDRYQSAVGIQHDLQQCLIQWNEKGEIAAFGLGQRDLSDRFLIPEKLYGREAEVKMLLDAFERIAAGASELMLVAGCSGIGKTAVVNEVHKLIVRQRGYFIKGKYDQFHRDLPLSAFVQALRDLMGQLLCESAAQLSQWRNQILAAVGENGQVLIEVIPELEQMIGKQPPVSELSDSAAQNRFNLLLLLLQKFIAVFTTAAYPLVIFLDDLQWADAASLQLIKLLLQDNHYLLLLGAYRDNEVSPVHPLMLTVEALKKAQAMITPITLSPLAFDHVNQLVADTLHCSKPLAKPLSELVNSKTQGSPFFIAQFLKALYEAGCISFNQTQRCWECDLAEANAFLQQRPVFSISETMFATDLPSSHAGTQSSSGSSSISATLDLATVLKASQLLSKSIQLDDLLHQLVQIMLQNSGGEACILVLPDADGNWQVRAMATPDAINVTAQSLERNRAIPQKLIRYVRSTRQTVVIDDLKTDLPVIDEYLRQEKPRSILCMPILNQGQLIGILYLKNRLTSGVFTSDRVELLNCLCVQAAICLENARLYSGLHNSQRQMATLLSNLTGMAYSCANDANWTTQFASQGCLALTGYLPEELVNNHRIAFGKLICTDDVDMVNTTVQNALQNYQPFQITYRIRTKQGEEKWVWEQGQGVFDASGKLLTIEGFVTDISDRKQAEAQLHEKELFLRSIYEGVNQGICVIDVTETGDFRYAGWNSFLESIVGIPSPEIIGKNPEELLGDTYGAAVRQNYQRCLTAGTTISYEEFIPVNGQDVWWLTTLTPLRDETGQIYRLILTTIEITERKQAETALKEKIRLLALRSAIDSSLAQSRSLSETLQQCTQAIVDHLDAAFARIWLLNESAQVLELQASAGLHTHLDGLHQAVPVGQFKIGLIAQERRPHLTNDVLNDPRVGDKAWAQREGMVAFAGYPLVVGDQLLGVLAMFARQPLPASVLDTLSFIVNEIALGIERQQTAQALAASEAELKRKAEALAQSMQELQQAQLQTVQSEKMASLGNLVAGVAHEINNPIGFLNGSISNAKDYVQDLFDHLALYQQHHPPGVLVQDHAEEIDLEYLSADLPKLLHSMKEATDRIKNISTSLRTFSRADTEYKVNANLHEGLDSTLLILKYRLKANEHRPAIAVVQNYGELPLVECFPGQLNQVFMNILANAIDVFDEMAQSQSFAELEAHQPQIKIRTATAAQQVQICISDNGKGMTEAIRARIFDHLFTTKGVGKGTGLGLAIVRQIIEEAHGGTIEVISELGKGSEFVIHLPIQQTPSQTQSLILTSTPARVNELAPHFCSTHEFDRSNLD